MKPRPALVALVLLLVPLTASGDDKDDKSANDGIPLPIGHEAAGLRLPNYASDTGALKSEILADKVLRTAADLLDLKGVSIRIPAPAPDTAAPPSAAPALAPSPMTITMREATYVPSTGRLHGRGNVKISRPDLDILGEELDFDTLASSGEIIGPSTMLLHPTAKEPQK